MENYIGIGFLSFYSSKFSYFPPIFFSFPPLLRLSMSFVTPIIEYETLRKTEETAENISLDFFCFQGI